MAIIDQDEFMGSRFTKQLHGFSELTEILSIRLLDLEERLLAVENNQDLLLQKSSYSSYNVSEAKEESVDAVKGMIQSRKSDYKNIENSMGFEEQEKIVNSKESLDNDMSYSFESNQDQDDLSSDQFKKEEFCSENNLLETHYEDDPQYL